MSRSPLQSPLGRILILALAVSSLIGYVVMSSTSRPVEPTPKGRPAANSSVDSAVLADSQSAGVAHGAADLLAAPDLAAASTAPDSLVPDRFYGSATKSAVLRLPPLQAPPRTKDAATKPATPPRIYGPATKSDLVLPPHQ
ncbi:MAG: hypothetical protein JNM83_17025 [Myxococcales bacterium]|nr:hypothetical protein [Myxococcales bacterium]